MKKHANQGTKDFKTTTRYRYLSIALSIVAGFLLIFSIVFHIQSNRIALNRTELTNSATQFMNASAYLTSEVRAYVTTGEQVHYDNYWNEVYQSKNREIGVKALKDLGVTQEQSELIDKMAALSDELVPHEAEAMELRKKGDIDGAIAIVYGKYYNDSIAEIRAMRNSLREMVEESTSNSLSELTTKYTIVNAITWVLAISIVIIQIIQKKLFYRLAYINQLTGIPNYFAFREKMRYGIKIKENGYIIATDLKSFHIINEICGIAKGDEILHNIGKILQDETNSDEIAAHITGDRFVMFLQSSNDKSLIERLTAIREKIVNISESVDVPYLIPTFGICEVTNTEAPERKYGDANFANNTLKNSDEDTFYAFFDQQMQDQLLNNRRLEDGFDDALQDSRFEVWYQPKYSPEQKGWVGAEGLVRWRTANNELIPPVKFIPLFERNGMIPRLDTYMFESICAQQKAWIDAGKKLLPISVNLSRISLFYNGMVSKYITIADKYNIPHDCVELEVTESALQKSDNIEEILQQFRANGFHIIMDDFGSGYSSLSALTQDCFDVIKIDKSIIDSLETPKGYKLVKSTIDLAHDLGITVTAEGVETQGQAELLKNLNCDNIQGYFYSRPIPLADFEALINK